MELWNLKKKIILILFIYIVTAALNHFDKLAQQQNYEELINRIE